MTPSELATHYSEHIERARAAGRLTLAQAIADLYRQLAPSHAVYSRPRSLTEVPPRLAKRE